VQALLHLTPQTTRLGFGDRVPLSGYVALWFRITCIPAILEKVIAEEQGRATPGGFDGEMAEMYGYLNDFGYNGRDPAMTLSSQ
jgi:hypothetical protein